MNFSIFCRLSTDGKPPMSLRHRLNRPSATGPTINSQPLPAIASSDLPLMHLPTATNCCISRRTESNFQSLSSIHLRQAGDEPQTSTDRYTSIQPATYIQLLSALTTAIQPLTICRQSLKVASPAKPSLNSLSLSSIRSTDKPSMHL